MCPLRLESQFPSGLRKAYNQIPLALKARVLGNFQSFCWIPRLGSLMWGSEPSQEYENFFGIIVLQSVGHPPGGYGISFIVLAPPPTISLGLPLCLWMWGTFFFFFFELQHPPVNHCSTASCSFDALTGRDECTSFCSAILNQKPLFCFISLSDKFF